MKANPDLLAQLSRGLSEIDSPIVDAYELAKLIFRTVPRSGGPAALKKEHQDWTEVLTRVGFINPLSGTHAYIVFGHSNTGAAELACGVDPFAYLSHLSAMEHHGLTDRFPKILYLTTPPLMEWRKQADSKMERELGSDFKEYLNSGLPRLKKPSLKKIGQTLVNVHDRSHMGAFRIVNSPKIRVATLGRTYLDMLREPELCGGLQHVIDVYEANAKRHQKLIVEEFERHGNSIDKVRAGFILSTVCGLDNEQVNSWKKYAQRGGSRKLDAQAEYSSNYSEEWKLSVNVPSLINEDENFDEL